MARCSPLRWTKTGSDPGTLGFSPTCAWATGRLHCPGPGVTGCLAGFDEIDGRLRAGAMPPALRSRSATRRLADQYISRVKPGTCKERHGGARRGGCRGGDRADRRPCPDGRRCGRRRRAGRRGRLDHQPGHSVCGAGGADAQDGAFLHPPSRRSRSAHWRRRRARAAGTRHRGVRRAHRGHPPRPAATPG